MRRGGPSLGCFIYGRKGTKETELEIAAANSPGGQAWQQLLTFASLRTWLTPGLGFRLPVSRRLGP
jgi:hypothetical protein